MKGIYIIKKCGTADRVTPSLTRGLEFEPKEQIFFERDCFPPNGALRDTNSDVVRLQCEYRTSGENKKKQRRNFRI